jgi:hypothetical protein
MKDFSVKLGCFLIGHNYRLIKHSSESSSLSIKKYLSAMLLVTLVWAFIGYAFATRYLHLDIVGGIAGAIVMGFIVIQVERIIILSPNLNWGAKTFRMLLGVVMAILGAAILDQITFKDDIEIYKAKNMAEEVVKATKLKRIELDSQIEDIQHRLDKASESRDKVSEELSARPVIVTRLTNRSTTTDEEGKAISNTSSTNSVVSENPKKLELEQLDKQLASLLQNKFEKEQAIFKLQEDVEKELKSKSGFLDEINILAKVIGSSWVGMVVYFLFMFFFLCIELFVIFIKISDKDSDYEVLLKHQYDTRLQMLNALK